LENVTFADIGIKEKFWLQQDQIPHSSHSFDDTHTVTSITAFPQNEPYSEVIMCIQKMVEQSTPALKIQSLIEASNTIVSCVDNYYKKKMNDQQSGLQRETHPHFATEKLPPLMEDVPLTSSSLQTFSSHSQQPLEKCLDDKRNKIFKESDVPTSQIKAVDDNEAMAEMRQMKSLDEELSSSSVSDLKPPQRPRRGSLGSFTLPKTLSSPVLKRNAVTPSSSTTTTPSAKNEINSELKETETIEMNSLQKQHVHFASDARHQVIAM
jgi:hypothetical protein